ncbi:MAG: hypothetical protein U0794_18600 [Isosphaeraceae bacterium]
MDQRDRTRTTPTEGRGRGPEVGPIDVEPIPGPAPRRISRLVGSHTTKRFARNRLVWAVIGSLVGLGILLLLGTNLAVRLVAYVRNLPAYQISYREIELDPPPPSWYRGGSTAFLDHVWSVWPERKVFSLLEIEPSRIQSLFQRSPWVERVRRVESLPGRRFVVRLDYRVPVAIAEFPDSTRIWVDREGVVLPRDDVDEDLVGKLVGLHGFAPPLEVRYGETWSRADRPGEDRVPDERVVEAAALADFLRTHLGELGPHLTGPPHAVVQRFKERGLYVQVYGDSVADSLMVFWKHDPRSDPATSRLTDEERWNMLREWLARSAPRGEGKLVYLWFTRKGVEIDGRYGNESASSLNDRRSNGSTRRR